MMLSALLGAAPAERAAWAAKPSLARSVMVPYAAAGTPVARIRAGRQARAPHSPGGFHHDPFMRRGFS